MGRLKATAQDLAMLKMGLCPNCGAHVRGGMPACSSCKIEFGEHANVAPAAGPAPPKPAAAPTAPAAAAAPTAPAAARPAAPAPAGARAALDVDELERGLAARGRLPLTGAQGPEVLVEPKWLAHGPALLAVAHALMADAALADDPAVLATRNAPATHIPRAVPNLARSSAAHVDDAAALLASRGAPPPPTTTTTTTTTRPAPAAPPPGDETTGVDPEATVLHDANAILRIAAEIDRSRASGTVSARGGARPLDD